MSLKMSSLQRALALTTLLTCVLAHSYRYRSGSIFKRPHNMIEEKREPYLEVDCPVCMNDKCERSPENNNWVKICKFGTFKNRECDNRLDCFAGPGEYCDDVFEVVNPSAFCAEGLKCNSNHAKCEGTLRGISWYPVNPAEYQQ